MKGYKYAPKDLRVKKTRAIRRALTKSEVGDLNWQLLLLFRRLYIRPCPPFAEERPAAEDQEEGRQPAPAPVRCEGVGCPSYEQLHDDMHKPLWRACCNLLCREVGLIDLYSLRGFSRVRRRKEMGAVTEEGQMHTHIHAPQCRRVNLLSSGCPGGLWTRRGRPPHQSHWRRSGPGTSSARRRRCRRRPCRSPSWRTAPRAC